MDFDELVKFIKAQGCKVVVYKSKERVNGAYGEFNESSLRINIATKSHSNKMNTSTLLHEYAHFLQWKEGFSQYIDGICPSYEVHYDWINGRLSLTETERIMARNCMLTIEYDAELRSYKLGHELNAKNFDPEYHMQEANSYMAHLKWTWRSGLEWEKRLSYKNWKPKKMTHEELFAPLSDTEKQIFKQIKPKKKRRKKRVR